MNITKKQIFKRRACCFCMHDLNILIKYLRDIRLIFYLFSILLPFEYTGDIITVLRAVQWALENTITLLEVDMYEGSFGVRQRTECWEMLHWMRDDEEWLLWGSMEVDWAAWRRLCTCSVDSGESSDKLFIRRFNFCFLGLWGAVETHHIKHTKSLFRVNLHMSIFLGDINSHLGNRYINVLSKSIILL
jgi:hypothetical protein